MSQMYNLNYARKLAHDLSPAIIIIVFALLGVFSVQRNWGIVLLLLFPLTIFPFITEEIVKKILARRGMEYSRYINIILLLIIVEIIIRASSGDFGPAWKSGPEYWLGAVFVACMHLANAELHWKTKNLKGFFNRYFALAVAVHFCVNKFADVLFIHAYYSYTTGIILSILFIYFTKYKWQLGVSSG